MITHFIASMYSKKTVCGKDIEKVLENIENERLELAIMNKYNYPQNEKPDICSSCNEILNKK